MKIKRFIISALVFLVWIMIGQVAYAESELEPDIWDGTIEQPTETIRIDNVYYYKITKASELAYIAQTGGDWLEYKYILYNDIILNDADLSADDSGELVNGKTGLLKWVPIGYRGGYFRGVFDGNGHSISGMYINNSNYIDLGLFGSTYGCIKNLDVKNAYISISPKNPLAHTGGIVSGITNGTIENCSFYGTITEGDITDTTYAECTGGIVGLAGMASHVVNCNNYGSIINVSNSGGIAGETENSYITNCTNYGDVIEGSVSGGIAGSVGSGGNVENCINYGNVTGDAEIRIGGIAGHSSGGMNFSIIKKCQNYGAVKGDSQVGGICGLETKEGSAGSGVSDSINKGPVLGNSYVGGIVGQCSKSDVHSCFSTGNVTGESETGAVIGNSTHMTGSGSVTKCYYLKTAKINSALFAFGNGDDDEGIAMPCSLELVEAKASNCTTKGNSAYWKCTPIGTYYSDEDGLNEIEKNSWLLEVDPSNHIYGDWAVTKEATCTEDGIKEKVCSACGNKITDTIPANGHSWDEEFTVDKEATCTEEGSKSRHCANCDEKKDITVIPITAHEYEWDVTKTPTHTEDGEKALVCVVCGAVKEGSQGIIPRDYDDHRKTHVAYKEATTIAEGNIEYWYCEVCKKYFKDEACTQEITKAETVIAKLPDDGGVTPGGGDTPPIIPDTQDEEAAKIVETAIENINLEDPDPKAVAEARAAYDALSEETKAKVPKECLNKLEAAEKKIKTDKQIAEAVSMIEAILVDDPDAESVAKARSAYDALENDAKEKISADLLQKLEAAEKRIKEKAEQEKTAAAEKATIEEFEALIDSIAVDDPDPLAVAYARAAYNYFSDDIKSKIPAEYLEKLAAAEKKLDNEAQKTEGNIIKTKAGLVEVTSKESKTLLFIKANEKSKSIVLPGKVKVADDVFMVTEIKTRAFKGSKAVKVTVSKYIKKINKKAFASSKVKTVIIKSKKLTKKNVKQSLAGSKVTLIKINVGSKAQNKKYLAKYKKIFTKANAGKKVKIIAA